MARMLVDAAHSIDGDFLDQQLLVDPGVVNAVVTVGDLGAARCRLGRGPVGTGVLLHGNPPVVDRGAWATARPVRPMLVTVWPARTPVTMLPAVIAPSGWTGSPERGTVAGGHKAWGGSSLAGADWLTACAHRG